MPLVFILFLCVAPAFSFVEPHFPFQRHSFTPGNFWGSVKGPYPTNAWWTNAVQGYGNKTIDPLPYLTRFHHKNGLQVSKPKGTKFDDKYAYYQFSPEIIVGAAEKLGRHEVIRYDPLSVTFKIPTASGSMTFPLVRGSPYISVQLQNSSLFLRSSYYLTFLNGIKLNGSISQVSGQKFEIQLKNGQTWLLYSFVGNVTFDCSVKGMRARGPSTGFFRLVLLTNSKFEWILDRHAHVVPLGGRVSYEVHEDLGTVKFDWSTIGVNRTLSAHNSEHLLMLSLPYHDQALLSTTTPPIMIHSFHTIRGPMTGRLGSSWSLLERLPTGITWPTRPITNQKYFARVFEALQAEKGTTPNIEERNVYKYGRMLSKLAQLVLIADQLAQSNNSAVSGSSSSATSSARQLASELRTRLRLALDPWIHADNVNYFVYDDVYKGICTMNGLLAVTKDYGNGWYNHHHLQYGYFVYAAAAIAAGDSEWAAVNSPILQKIYSLIADFATPTQDNPAFPFARHKDWFTGVSWSSGLFALDEGKNLPSSSEAVHAYYSAFLFARLTGHQVLANFARLLLAGELRAANLYFHIYRNTPNRNILYGKPFSLNKVVGNLWSSRADFHSSFGNNTEFAHCMQMLPFTPISEKLLNYDWMVESFPALSPSFHSSSVNPRWRSCIVMAGAIVDPSRAWKEATKVDVFDTLNSQTNMLFWIATRPPPPNSPEKKLR